MSTYICLRQDSLGFHGLWSWKGFYTKRDYLSVIWNLCRPGVTCRLLLWMRRIQRERKTLDHTEETPGWPLPGPLNCRYISPDKWPPTSGSSLIWGAHLRALTSCSESVDGDIPPSALQPVLKTKWLLEGSLGLKSGFRNVGRGTVGKNGLCNTWSQVIQR